MKTNIEKLEALKENEAFLNEMSNATTIEEQQAVFARYDVEFSVEDIQEILCGAKVCNNEELSAEDLDDVSGGLIVFPTVHLIVAAALAYLIVKAAQRASRRR